MTLKKTATTHLFFVYSSNQLAAWSISLPNKINRLPLNGEDIFNVNSDHALQEATKDAFSRLRSKGQQADIIHWITTNQDQISLIKSKVINQGFTNWQILNWSWLSQRFAVEQDPWRAITTLEEKIFPWLATANKANERKKIQETLQREHQTKAEELAQERADLEKQNEQLRAQNEALQNIDAENLVRFLPALFPRVFTVLGATDLALLCGRVEPLAIRNPYPEPSGETLYVLQKDFRNLPKNLQKEIVSLVARLPQRKDLRPRAEMRNLVTELEES